MTQLAFVCPVVVVVFVSGSTCKRARDRGRDGGRFLDSGRGRERGSKRETRRERGRECQREKERRTSGLSRLVSLPHYGGRAMDLSGRYQKIGRAPGGLERVGDCRVPRGGKSPSGRVGRRAPRPRTGFQRLQGRVALDVMCRGSSERPGIGGLAALLRLSPSLGGSRERAQRAQCSNPGRAACQCTNELY